MRKLETWMNRSSAAEKKRLAALAGTNMTYLYAIEKNKRQASSYLAARIAKASIKLHKENPKLPVLLRGDISSVCQQCPYSPRCAK